MRFDSSAATQAAMCRSLGLDPRMIRFSVIKLADRLGTKGQIQGTEEVGGKVDWMAGESWRDTEVGSFMDRQRRRASPGLGFWLEEGEEGRMGEEEEE